VVNGNIFVHGCPSEWKKPPVSLWFLFIIRHHSPDWRAVLWRAVPRERPGCSQAQPGRSRGTARQILYLLLTVFSGVFLFSSRARISARLNSDGRSRSGNEPATASARVVASIVLTATSIFRRTLVN